MNATRLAAELNHLAGRPGVVGCALVDADTGLVWQACSSSTDASAPQIWEAAVDYWRLYARQKQHFAGLGELGVAAMYHTLGVLAVLPCCTDPSVLLVLHANHKNVDWIELQRMTHELGRLIRFGG
jgi:hypothetical protein